MKLPRLSSTGFGLPFLALLAGACATAPPPAPVDLEPARKAIEAARQPDLVEIAQAFLARAEEHLKEAERLAASPKPEDRTKALTLAPLAEAEAEAAASLGKLGRELTAAREAPAPSNDAEVEKLKARLRKSGEEQKRLDERVALLQRDLDLTETEIIRTKAKLKGIETKAEASSAIAEARILMLRLMDERSRSANITRSQEKLERAERQLREGNYGAAVFFALQAQELLDDSRRAGAPAAPSAARKKYVVAAAAAKVRKEPAPSAPVLGTVPKGTALEALAEQGSWVKVAYQGRAGWISRSVLE